MQNPMKWIAGLLFVTLLASPAAENVMAALGKAGLDSTEVGITGVDGKPLDGVGIIIGKTGSR